MGGATIIEERGSTQLFNNSVWSSLINNNKW